MLHRLIAGPDALPSEHTVTLLVRGEDRVNKLKQAYGDRVQPILFNTLDDTAAIEEVASQHDLIINAGTGFHTAGAVAMIRGLSKRRQDNGYQPWMIHTSGCSNVGDAPLSGQSHPDRWFDDADALNIYEFEKAEDAIRPYAQRTTALAVIDAGEETNVKTISLQPPNIVGEGSGLFGTSPSITQVFVRYVLEQGYGFQLGDGSGQLGFVHVEDLADLYVLLVRRIVEGRGEELPHGKQGIIFPCVGMTTWVDMSWGCLEAAFKKGLLPKEGGPQKKEVRKIDLDELVAAGVPRQIAVYFSAHCNTVGTVAKQLGWKHAHGFDAEQEDYETELTAVLDGRRQTHLVALVAEEK